MLEYNINMYVLENFNEWFGAFDQSCLSYHSIITIYITWSTAISPSNLELEEEKDTSNGARSLAALNVAVLGLLLITELLIFVDWGPTVTKQEYGVQIASIIVVYVLVFVLKYIEF